MDDDEVPLCPLCLAWPPLVRKQPSLTTSSICVTFQPLASLFINIACFPFLFNNLIPTETPMIEPTVIAACLPLRPKSSDGARQSSDGCDLKLRLRVPPLPLGQSGRPTLSCPRRRTISDCSILKCGLPGKNRTRNIPITTQTEPLLRRDLGGDRSDPEFSLQHPFLTLMTLWHPMNEQLLRRSDESMPQYYTYSMQQLKDAIINIHPPNRTILPSQDLTHTPCRIIDLYKVKEGVSMGNLLTIIKQINKKNIQNKHMHLIHYQRVELLASKDIPLKRVQPGQYLAMIRANQPLVRQKRILMTLKQKIDYMLAIAKAVQSLHTTRRSNFGLNLRQIYTSSSGQIKIGSNFNAQIARLVFNKSRQPSFAPDSPEQKRMFDIWCLAVVFIQIMINGRLVIKWQDYSQTLLSIKALLRYTTHIFFYAVRSLLRKMLRQGERQIDINRVVRKLKKMSRVTEEQLKASEPPLRQMALSLISKGPPIIPQSLITETNQRIVIVDAFQVFLTFYQQQQLIVIEIIHPETDCLVVTAKYTFQSLPKNIRSKHKNLLSFFRFIQYLHPNSFSLTKEGLLSLSPL